MDGKCERYFAICLVIERILDKEFEIIFHKEIEINFKIIRPLTRVQGSDVLFRSIALTICGGVVEVQFRF